MATGDNGGIRPLRQSGERSGLTPGSPSNELSFSWSKLPTVGSHHDDLECVPPPANRSSAAEMQDLLKKKIAFLSGGRDKLGQSLISFSARSGKQEPLDRNHVRRTVQYLASIPTEDVRECGFSVVIDARSLKWDMVKLILRAVQEALPGQVHSVYIVQPSQFMQRKKMGFGHNKEKGKLEFSTTNVSSLDKLTQFIDPRQLTFDLGGSLPYNHEEWIVLRLSLERFVSSFHALMEHSTHLEQQIQVDHNSPSVPQAKEQLARLTELGDQIEKSPQTTVRDGMGLLRSFEQQQGEAGASGMTPDKINAISIIRQLLESIQRRQTVLEELWLEKKTMMEQTLQMKLFESASTKIRGWLKSHADEAVRGTIGDNLTAAQALQEQHDKFEMKTQVIYNELNQLRRMADRMVGSGHVATETIRRQVAKLNTRYSVFESQLIQRRNIIHTSVSLHHGMEEWRSNWESCCTSWKTDAVPDNLVGVDDLLDDVSGQLSQLIEMAEGVHSDIEMLIELLQSASVSVDGGSEYRRSLRHLSKFNDELNDKKRVAEQVASAKIARLEQYQQLHSCEKDAKQAAEWLADMHEQVMCQHGSIGESYMTTCALSEECKKFMESAKATYKYSSELLVTAQNQRSALKIDLRPNLAVQDSLNMTWEALSDALQEEEGRLLLSEQFYHALEEALNTLFRWVQPVQDLPHSLAAVDGLLKEIVENRHNLAEQIEECIGLGQTLCDKLLRPLIADPDRAPGELNEASRVALGYLQGRIRNVMQKKNALSSILDVQMGRLSSVAKHLSLELNIEEILLWLQDHGLPTISSFCKLGDTLDKIMLQLSDFESFNETCMALSEKVKEIQAELSSDSVSYDNGRHSDMVRRADDMSRVWDRFLFRVENRKHVLSVAWSFFKYINDAKSVFSDLLSLSSGVLTKQQHKVYQDSLPLYERAVQEGTNLAGFLVQSPADSHDPVVGEKVKALVRELQRLHTQLQELVSVNHLSKLVEVEEEDEDKEKKQPVAAAENKKVNHVAKRKEKKVKQKPKVAVEKKKEEAPASSQPPPLPARSKPSSKAAFPVASSEQPVDEEDNLKQLTASAQKHYEHLDKAFDAFLRKQSTLADSPSDVKKMITAHQEFKTSIELTCAQLKDVVDGLKAVQGSLRKPRAITIYQHIEKKLSDVDTVLSGRLGLLQLFNDFVSALGQTTTELHNMEQFLDSAIKEEMEEKTAELLQKQLPLFQSISINLQHAKTAGEKLASEMNHSRKLVLAVSKARKFVCQELKMMEEIVKRVGEAWEKKEQLSKEIASLQDFRSSAKRLTKWLTVSGDYFMVGHSDLGTSLVSAENLLADHKTFQKKAEHTTEDVRLTCQKAEDIVAGGHLHVAAVQEEARALDALNASFQEKVLMRLDGLTMSVDFYRQAQEMTILLNTVAGALRTSSAKLTSVTEKFEALQMRGAELINHMKRARHDHDIPGNSSSLRVNRVPLQSTEGCVKEILSKIQQTLEEYQEKAGKQGVRLEARRGSIKDLEDVLEDIDTSVQKTLRGTASPAPPSATESLKSREAVKTNIAKRSSYKRTVAPMKFSLWDRQGSVRQLRKKFEKIASDEKPSIKISEEQKLLDRVFRDPFVAQAKLKQTSSVQPVIKVNVSDQAEPTKHPILRGRPSIEKLHIDRNVTRLREKFNSHQETPTIHEVPVTSSEDTSADAPPLSNGVLTNGDLGPDETDSIVKENTTELRTNIDERSQEHSTEPVEETDFGLWKKKKPLQKTESLNKKSFKSLSSVIWGLMHSEKDYVNCLSRLVEGYMPAFDSSDLPTFLTGQKEVVFGHLTKLFTFHQHLHYDLFAVKDSVEDISRCFISNKEGFLECYLPVVEGFMRGYNILSRYGGTFFTDWQQQQQFGGDLLSDYNRPFERMKEYQELLEEMLRCSQKENLHGIGSIKDALDVVEFVIFRSTIILVVQAIQDCPFKLNPQLIVCFGPFIVYLAGKKKHASEYQVFLHRHYIILTEAEWMEPNACWVYHYVDSVQLSRLMLIENYHNQPDRFAVCEEGPAFETTQMMVFKCVQKHEDEVREKQVWVDEIKKLLALHAEEAKPRQTLQLSQMEQLSLVQDPPSGDSKERFSSLKRKGSLKRRDSLKKKDNVVLSSGPPQRQNSFKATKKETAASVRSEFLVAATSITPTIKLGRQTPEKERKLKEKLKNLFIVTEPFSCDKEGYLSVFPGQVVELLEEGQQYWLVCSLASVKGELESEGFIPSNCLTQLTEEQLELLKFPTQSNSSDHSQSATISPDITVSPVPSLPSKPEPEVYYATQDYKSTVNGTVNVKKGQKVTLLESSNEKWWLVELVPDSSGEEPSSAGLLPPRILSNLAPQPVVPTVAAPVALREKPSPQQLSSNAAVMPSNLFGRQGKATPDFPQDGHQLEMTHTASPRAFFPQNMDVAAAVSLQDDSKSPPTGTDSWPLEQSTELLDLASGRGSSSSQTELYRSLSLPSMISRDEDDGKHSLQHGSVNFLAGRPQRTPIQPLQVQANRMAFFASSDNGIYGSQISSSLSHQQPMRDWPSTEQSQEPHQYEFQGLSEPSQFDQHPDFLQAAIYHQQQQGRQDGGYSNAEGWQRQLSDIYIVMADYKATEPGTVDLRAGQRVQVLDSSQNHWWKLRLLNQSGIEGYAPSNYLTKWHKPLPPTSRPPPSPLPDFESEEAPSIPPNPNRRGLYEAPFLMAPDQTHPDEPTRAQLDGVFSLKVLYVAAVDIKATQPGQLSLSKGQHLQVIDSKRDDWWLVRTKDTGSHSALEGWVARNQLQHHEYIREDDSSASPDSRPMSASLWITMAAFIGQEEGTLSVQKGELVEVIDTSRNEWTLIRTVDREPKEGWIPSDFIKRYNYMDPYDHLRPSPITPSTALSMSPRYPYSPSYYTGTLDTVDPFYGSLSQYSLASPDFHQEEADPDEGKRKAAAQQQQGTMAELVSTEREYVHSLEYCITHYKTAIETSTTGSLKTLRPVCDYLFGNIADLHRFHKEVMLPKLQECLKDATNTSEVFMSSVSHLKSLYVTYCMEKRRSEDIIGDNMDTLKELSVQLKDRLTLRDYLIKPIQRITKYSLFLSNLRKYSARAGTPIPNLDSALEATHQVSRKANNAVHLSMIEGFYRRAQEFGELILQDGFTFLEPKSAAKERRVFLFERALVITKRKRDTNERESYIVRDAIMLGELSISEDVKDQEKKTFVIYIMTSGDKLTLKAVSTRVRDQWIHHTSELITEDRQAPVPPAVPRGRSMSDPPEPPRNITQLQQSGRRRTHTRSPSGSARVVISPPAKKTSEHVEPGTKFVVMECIVMEGGDDLQLEQGDLVELVRVESSGNYRVRMVDDPSCEGVVFPNFLRLKDSVTTGAIPKITIPPPSIMTLRRGSPVTISCAFNGDPAPSVVWKKSKEEVLPSERISISSCNTSTVLKLSSAEYSDSGSYSCFVSNNMGSDFTHVELLVEGPPSSPSKPVVSNISRTQAKLKWTSPAYDGTSPIVSYQLQLLQDGLKDWQPIMKLERTNCTVKTLEPNISYQFRVLAINDLGFSNPSEPTDVVKTKVGRGSVSSAGSRTVTDDSDAPMELSPMSQLSPDTFSPVAPSSPHSGQTNRISKHYTLLHEELGRGRFGLVQKYRHKQTNVLLAAKYLKTSPISRVDAVREVELLQRAGGCTNVVQIMDFVETDNNLVIITELVTGGELLECIISSNSLTEAVAVYYLQQLLSALIYLSQRNIAHLDIKPENLLLTADDSPVLKIIDFGSARDYSIDPTAPKQHSFDQEFSAPELFTQGRLTATTDVWSVGVLTYILLSGISPFFMENLQSGGQKITEARYDFYPQAFEQISPEAKDFITCLLHKNSTLRLSPSKAQQHSWIKTLSYATRGTPWPMPRLDTTRLQAFKARRKWHTTSMATLAGSLFSGASNNPTGEVPFSPVHDDEEEEKPSSHPPRLWDGVEQVTVALGASVTLHWAVSGAPDPSVVWEHEERKVMSSGRVMVKTEGGVTSLTITEVVRSDEGVYTCCALNGLGSEIRECKVMVLDKPSVPSSVTGVILGSYNLAALISWMPAVNDGNSPVTNYILEQRRIDFETWELVADDIEPAAYVVEGLLPNVPYLFRVAAVNSIGMSPFSKPSPPITMATETDANADTQATVTAEVRMKVTELSEEYDLREDIAQGNFAVVRECVEWTTNRTYAAKLTPASHEKDRQRAMVEYEILRQLNHPRVIRLEDAFDCGSHIALIMEYASGGDLQSFLASSPLQEAQAARFTRHVLEGLQYLHEQGIVHVDIRSDNLLLTTSQHELKLAGFSFARYLDANNQLQFVPESMDYMAPEVIRLQTITGSADIWSVGVVTLFMLTSTSPFLGSKKSETVQNILSCTLHSTCNKFLSIASLDCCDFLMESVLVPNSRKRLTAHQCQRHRWLKSAGLSSAGSRQRLSTLETVEYYVGKYGKFSPSQSQDT